MAIKRKHKSRKPSPLIDHPVVKKYRNGEFINAPIEELNPTPDQPRKIFEEEPLKQLSKSVEENGVLQPLVIRYDNDKFWIVAGERRYRAAKSIGLKEIPCIVTTGDPEEISLIENIQRENLKPVEEAAAYAKMKEKYSYTHEQIAKIVGLSRTTISERMSLNKLPIEVKEQCRHDDIPMRSLIEVAKEKTPEEMAILYDRITKNNIKSGDVRGFRKTKPDGDKVINKRTESDIIYDKTAHLIKALEKVDDPKQVKKKLLPILDKLRIQLDRFME